MGRKCGHLYAFGMVHPRLDPVFVNVDLAVSILGLGPKEAERFLYYARPGSGYENVVQHDLAQLLSENLGQLGVLDLQRAVLDGSLAIGSLVGLQQSFYFKRGKSPSGHREIRMWNRLNTDSHITVEAHVDPDRLVFSSAHGLLSRHNSFYLLGVAIKADSAAIAIRPVFIGWRSFGLSADEIKMGIRQDRLYVHPSEIDQFSEVDFQRRLSSKHLSAVALTAEQTVKEALAKILGDPRTAKDWGGERSDHYSTQLTIGGVPHRSAWLLKGKSVKTDMRIAHLGKNGDQIDRLFSEPADLYVVQSNQKISSDVRNMLDVYAHDYRRVSRYSLLDGYDTARVLLAHGKLPLQPPIPAPAPAPARARVPRRRSRPSPS